MSMKKDGGPAFPYGQRNITEQSSEGMSLRDYFAAAALQGFIAAGAFDGPVNKCYKIADQMLEVRSEKKEAQP